jgi:hypothetical protein
MPTPGPHFGGIDPGFHGAVAVVHVDGTVRTIRDMPVIKHEEAKRRELDLRALRSLFRSLRPYGDLLIGIEAPTTRPGEPPEPAARFGFQRGAIEMAAICNHLAYDRIPPNLWKGRLNVPGKTDPRANEVGMRIARAYYPDLDESELVGPRGGIRDGRLDALLIAHWMRVRTAAGMRAVREQFGKDSAEAMAVMLTGNVKKRRSFRVT